MMNTTTLLSRVSLLTGGSKLCELKGHEHDPAKFYEVKGHDTTDPHLHTTFLDTTQELCRHHQHAFTFLASRGPMPRPPVVSSNANAAPFSSIPTTTTSSSS